MQPSEVFRKAKGALFEHGWTKRTVLDADGRMCMVGAIQLVKQGDARSLAAMDPEAIYVHTVLRDRVGRASIALFNDADATTLDDVVDVLDAAEKLAERYET